LPVVLGYVDMRPAATAAVVTAAALFAPAAALATPRIIAPIPQATVAQLAGSPTTSTSPTNPGQTIPPLLGPVVAVNIASDRTALNAYASYLQALVKSFPDSQAADTAYVSQISVDCKSALEPLTTSSGQVSTAVQTTLTGIGEEIGDDLAINFDATALDSFAKFSVALDRLRWSIRGRNTEIIQRYVNTQAALTELQPSGLCADALLAASSPQMVPEATRMFLKQYDKIAVAANNGLTNFLDLLRTYQTPAEQKLVTRIATLAAEVEKTSKSDLLANGQALTTVLETS
jgi:hypothetical protein